MDSKLHTHSITLLHTVTQIYCVKYLIESYINMTNFLFILFSDILALEVYTWRTYVVLRFFWLNKFSCNITALFSSYKVNLKLNKKNFRMSLKFGRPRSHSCSSPSWWWLPTPQTRAGCSASLPRTWLTSSARLSWAMSSRVSVSITSFQKF